MPGRVEEVGVPAVILLGGTRGRGRSRLLVHDRNARATLLPRLLALTGLLPGHCRPFLGSTGLLVRVASGGYRLLGPGGLLPLQRFVVLRGRERRRRRGVLLGILVGLGAHPRRRLGPPTPP